MNQCKCCGGMGCDVCNYGAGFAPPAAAVPEGALPPLPKADVYCATTEAGKPSFGKGWMFAPLQQLQAQAPLFTTEQMQAYARAAVEADRARQGLGLNSAICAPQAAETRIDTGFAAADGVGLTSDRAQQGEPVGWRDALEQARYALKEASGLHSLGFNECHASTCENGIDATGCTKEQYAKAAEGIRAAIAKARDMVRDALYRAATKAAAPADAPTVKNVLSVEAERRKFEGWARADLDMPDDMPFIWTSDWSKASWEAWMAAKVCAWLDAPSAAPVPDTGIPTAGEVEKAGNRFFNFNVLPTMTKQQEAEAEKGYCPTCGALELYEVNEACGMRFCQCNHCKDIVVLAAPSHPSEAKAGEDA